MDRCDQRSDFLQPARTHAEVAALMSQAGMPMSRSRVQQIERLALAKLRRALLRDGLTWDDLNPAD